MNEYPNELVVYFKDGTEETVYSKFTLDELLDQPEFYQIEGVDVSGTRVLVFIDEDVKKIRDIDNTVG